MFKSAVIITTITMCRKHKRSTMPKWLMMTTTFGFV